MRNGRFPWRALLLKVRAMNAHHLHPSASHPDTTRPLARSLPSEHAQRASIRVLVIPGLRNSGEAHWQTWLQRQYAGAVRVNQHNWHEADLSAWAARIDQVVARASRNTQWIAVAHSFGSLALAQHLARRSQLEQQVASVADAAGVGPRHSRIVAALMVAPADPVKFGLNESLPQHSLGLPLSVIGSENDPWMPLERAREWAHRWGGGFVNLGAVGHINTESGFGPWPLSRQKVDHLIRQQLRLNPSLCSQACGADLVS